MRLKWIGKVREDGTPEGFCEGSPCHDHEEPDEEKARRLIASGLFVEDKAKAGKEPASQGGED
jgi:hypothetical protein